MITIIFGIGFLFLSSTFHLNGQNIFEHIIEFFLGFYFLVIIFILLLIPFAIWFIVAADSIAKLLGWNRIVFNLLNLFSIFSGLPFITIIILWIKVKDKLEENG